MKMLAVLAVMTAQAPAAPDNGTKPGDDQLSCAALAGEMAAQKQALAAIGNQAVQLSERQAASQKATSQGAVAAQIIAPIVPMVGALVSEALLAQQHKQAANAMDQARAMSADGIQMSRRFAHIRKLHREKCGAPEAVAASQQEK
jgi:hypothetical protein